MKKTYERPLLRAEPFDAQDAITASAPTPAPTLDSTHNNFPVDGIPLDIEIN